MHAPTAPRRAITFAFAPALALTAALALIPLARSAAQDAPPPAAAPAAAAPPAAAPPASGAGPVYNVEMIVFRTATALGGPENWSAEAAGGGARSIAGDESGSGSQVGHFVAELPASVWQLGELESRLRASGYVPVAHVAWSQTPSSWGTRAGFPLQRLGINVPGLSGTVFLERGQFLHLGMSLSYADPTPPDGLGAAPGTTFTINESRRVKYYERNYFDNPAFGVIALVTPVQGSRAPGR